MIRKLKEYFENRKDIPLAYLFGSTASGKKGALSDTDIGVFIDAKFKDREQDIELELIRDLTDISHTKVDVIVMNSAPPLLKYNIIRQGVILKGSDDVRSRLEYEVMKEYLDTGYLREKHSKRIVREISERGLA